MNRYYWLVVILSFLCEYSVAQSSYTIFYPDSTIFSIKGICNQPPFIYPDLKKLAKGDYKVINKDRKYVQMQFTVGETGKFIHQMIWFKHSGLLNGKIEWEKIAFFNLDGEVIKEITIYDFPFSKRLVRKWLRD